MGIHLLGEFHKLWKLGQLCDVRLQLPNGTMLNVRIDRNVKSLAGPPGHAYLGS